MQVNGIEIRGIDGKSPQEVITTLENGSRFVFFEYCISLIFLTLRRPTAVYLLAPNELGLLRGMPFTLISVLLGWWGIPWGFICTPLTIITNFSGGRDITPAIRALLLNQSAQN